MLPICCKSLSLASLASSCSNLLLTLVYQGRRCLGEQTQALVTCHQETPAIIWVALSRSQTSHHTHDNQKYKWGGAVLSPGWLVYSNDFFFVGVHKRWSHPWTPPASSQFMDLRGLAHLFRPFGLIAHIPHHSWKHSHSQRYLSASFSLFQFFLYTNCTGNTFWHPNLLSGQSYWTA